MSWEAREKEIRERVRASLRGSGLVLAQDAGDLLTEIERLRRQQVRLVAAATELRDRDISLDKAEEDTELMALDAALRALEETP